MSRFSATILRRTVLFVALTQVGVLSTDADDSSRARSLFANPPREYASAPLWVWNDMLTEEQIRSTLRDLAGQKVKQVFVHPRPGLMTPYLSDDWFRLWKVALDEAERLGHERLDLRRELLPLGLRRRAGARSDARVARQGARDQRGQAGRLWPMTNSWPSSGGPATAYENVTAKARAGRVAVRGTVPGRLDPPGARRRLVRRQVLRRSAQAGRDREVHRNHDGAYRRQIGDQFGGRVPGLFTDEPHLAPAGGLHWSDHLPELFQQRWGYGLVDHLPSLVRPVGDWKRVRHNYYNLLLEQFIDRWAKPCYEYCEQHDLEFTGHYWEHGWPGAGHGGDNMAMYAWHQRPAIDTLMNQYSEDVHAQFGNVRAVQGACQRGQPARPQADALRSLRRRRLGSAIRGHEADRRLALRAGRQHAGRAPLLHHHPRRPKARPSAVVLLSRAVVGGVSRDGRVLHAALAGPLRRRAGQRHPADRADHHGLDVPGRPAQLDGRSATASRSWSTDLAKAQVEFDLGCEDIIARHGGVQDLRSPRGGPGPKSFVVGNRHYHTVVLPPHTENLNGRTMELLEDFARRGGQVVCCGPAPTCVDGSPSDRGAPLARLANWKQVAAEDLSGLLLESTSRVFSIRREEGDQGILFHHRRQLDDGEILFLVNTSIDSPCSGVIRTATLGIEQWCLETGAISPYPFESGHDGLGLKASFQLPPCGSLLLFLSDKPLEPAPARKTTVTRLDPVGPMGIRRLEPNVLTLDYVDVTAGGETKKNLYFYKANQFAFQQNG